VKEEQINFQETKTKKKERKAKDYSKVSESTTGKILYRVKLSNREKGGGSRIRRQFLRISDE